MRTWLRDRGAVVEAVDGPSRTRPELLLAFALPATFLVVDIAVLLYGRYGLGFDAHLYSLGARALLAGGDPWSVTFVNVGLAAPPSSILPYTLTAWLPPDVAAVVWVVGGLAAATWAVRRLRLRLWWLLFPPLFVSILIGGLDAFLPAALIAAPALAPFLKPYAVAGIIAERRWRSLLVAAVLLAPTLLLFPQWLAHDPAAILASQTRGLSAWGNPLLLLATVPALLSLGWRRGWYYAVPALWPYTQLHYAAMTLPAIRPVAAVAWCTPVGVIAEAVVDRIRRWTSRGARPAVDPGPSVR